MNATIENKIEEIIIRTTGTISLIEAEQIRSRIESKLQKTHKARLIFIHTGTLSRQVSSYQIWESLLTCLKSQHVSSVCFIFEKENAPFRFLAHEYARRAAVPCIHRESLEQVYA